MKLWKIFLLLPCVLLLGLGTVSSAGAEETRDTITVTGTAVSEAAPDMATLTLTLAQRGATAEAARAAVAEKYSALHNVLLGEAIDGRDVSTTGYSVGPEYEYDNKGHRSLKDYKAETTISVRVKNLDRLGAVLDKSVSRAEAEVENVSFGLQDEGKAERELLAAAVENAKAKAGVIASAGGRELGVLISARLQGSQGEQRVQRSNAMLMKASAGMDASEASTQLDPGAITLRVTVETVFSMHPAY